MHYRRGAARGVVPRAFTTTTGHCHGTRGVQLCGPQPVRCRLPLDAQLLEVPRVLCLQGFARR